MPPTPGSKAPPFLLPATDGQTISLDGLRRRKVVL